MKRLTTHSVKALSLLLTTTLLLSGCQSETTTAEETTAEPTTTEATTTESVTETTTEATTTESTTEATTEATTAETTIDTSTIEGYFLAYPEQFPLIDSSTARKPITAAIYEYFMSACTDESRLPQCSKTHGAWLNLADKGADLVFLVAPTEEEDAYFREKKVNVEMKPYGYDGLGFIVSPDCPVKELTSDQIRGIYECKITNWKEVGGPDAEIHPYFRDEQSGSQRLFEDFLWPDGNIPDFASMTDHFYFSDDMAGVTECVAYDPYAIGYNIVSYLNLEYEDYITAVKIDGALPTTENFANQTYPFITTAYVAIRADEPEDSPTRMLYDWIGSPESIEIIEGNSSLSVQVGESEILIYDN